MKEKAATVTMEFLYIPSQDDVRTVHIGVFPPRGRYFRRPMHPREDGTFAVELAVSPGEIYYHYFINNDFSTPRCNKVEQLLSENDPWQRSFIAIGASPFGAIEFKAGGPFLFNTGPGQWTLRAITHYSGVQALNLVFPGADRLPFTPLYRCRNKTYWQVFINGEKENPPPFFAISLKKENQEFFLHNNLAGLEFKRALGRDCFFRLPARAAGQEQQEREERVISPAEVGYQVFPDRFQRSGNPVPGTYPHPTSLCRWGDPPGEHSYFGGNIRGIIKKLNYLHDLGIDFIYLNPVFAALSPHRYDIVDYYRLDPLLGDSEDFRELVRQGHRRGIKIILDIPLNHCSTDFFAFKDVLQRQRESSYCQWFHIHRFPVAATGGNSHDYDYDSWHGHRHMPEFNLHNPVVQDYLVDALVYWLEHFDIDGIRLDTLSSLPINFVENFCRRVRASKPDILIIGESWNSAAASLLPGNKIDGITNYSFYWKVISPLFEKEHFRLDSVADAIMDIFYHLPARQACYSWNFLGNHDLPRLVSVMQDRRHYKLAAVLMYAVPGIPVIYYGEEIGLEGGNDPDNRRCMDWDRLKQREEPARFYKTMNTVRKRYETIFNEPHISIPYLDPDCRILVIRRFTADKSLAIIFNFGDRPVNLDLTVILNNRESEFTDVLDNRTGISHCCVDALDVKLIYYILP